MKEYVLYDNVQNACVVSFNMFTMYWYIIAGSTVEIAMFLIQRPENQSVIILKEKNYFNEFYVRDYLEQRLF